MNDLCNHNERMAIIGYRYSNAACILLKLLFFVGCQSTIRCSEPEDGYYALSTTQYARIAVTTYLAALNAGFTFCLSAADYLHQYGMIEVDQKITMTSELLVFHSLATVVFLATSLGMWCKFILRVPRADV
jgi:hypothetical protein